MCPPPCYCLSFSFVDIADLDITPIPSSLDPYVESPIFISFFAFLLYINWYLVLPISISLTYLQALGLNAHQFLLARWGSRRDLSLLTSISYVGFPLGVMLSHPLVSTLCLHGPWGGWPSVFYLMGAVGSLWCVVAAFLLHNNPVAHPLVSKQEIRYGIKNVVVCSL